MISFYPDIIPLKEEREDFKVYLLQDKSQVSERVSGFEYAWNFFSEEEQK